jgi:hypothetical protein
MMFEAVQKAHARDQALVRSALFACRRLPARERTGFSREHDRLSERAGEVERDHYWQYAMAGYLAKREQLRAQFGAARPKTRVLQTDLFELERY